MSLGSLAYFYPLNQDRSDSGVEALALFEKTGIKNFLLREIEPCGYSEYNTVEDDEICDTANLSIAKAIKSLVFDRGRVLTLYSKYNLGSLAAINWGENGPFGLYHDQRITFDSLMRHMARANFSFFDFMLAIARMFGASTFIADISEATSMELLVGMREGTAVEKDCAPVSIALNVHPLVAEYEVFSEFKKIETELGTCIAHPSAVTPGKFGVSARYDEKHGEIWLP